MSESEKPQARPVPDLPEELALLQRRFERERQARKEAEAMLNSKSLELFNALQQARDSEHRLQMALWASGEGIWEWQADSEHFMVQGLYVDGQEVEWPQVSRGALIERVHVDDRDAMSLAWRLHLAGARDDVDMAYRIRLDVGERWIRVRGRALERDGQGHPVRVAGTIKDITAQRESEQSLSLLASAFASTHDALLVVDDEGRVVEANRAFCGLAGQALAQIRGAELSAFVTLPAAAREGSGWRGESELRVAAGRLVPVEVALTFVAGQAGQSACHIVSLRDISERLMAESELARQALRDSLTALPNRAALDQHLQALLARGAADSFGLLFMDLDGFKAINDSFGHGVGDQVLREVAARLTQALPDAFIGRWGGDEFVLVLSQGSGDFEVRQAAQVLLATMATPFRLGYANDMMMSPSIGAVLYPHDGLDAQTLLRKADSAMYLAKEQGKNCLRMFEAEIEEGAMRRVRLQSLLRIDAERSGFTFVVQPKVDAEQRTVGGELLVRWSTRDFGSVSPAEFIPMAEQSGAIELLGRQALHSAARLAVELRRIGHAMPVAVNLSPRQLLNHSFERIALHACQRYGVEPSALELELTESAVSDASVYPLLKRLRRAGFGLALDDFGTGYSSLSHLLNLPFQKVKIDRAFVKEALENPKALVVIRGTLDICRGLGLTTVAEGVETSEQFELLRDMGVDEFQGYLFARPMPQLDWVRDLSDRMAASVRDMV